MIRRRQGMSRRSFAHAAVLISLPLLGGCDAVRESPLARNAARAIVRANRYEQINNIFRANRQMPIEQVMRDVIASGNMSSDERLPFAEMLVRQAVEMEISSRQDTGAAKANSRKRADDMYDLAVELEPEFPSQDPDLLNSLGYHYAQSGTSQEEFALSEKLTRRAVGILQTQIKAEGGTRRARLLGAAQANIRDSLGWALYRLGRYEEALKEQLQATKDAEAAVKAGLTPPTAEFRYHLGAIYQALGQKESAIKAYRESLQLPTVEEGLHEAARKALQELAADANKPSSPTQPREEQPPLILA